MTELEQKYFNEFCEENKITDFEQLLIDVSKGNCFAQIGLFNLIFNFGKKSVEKELEDERKKNVDLQNYIDSKKKKWEYFETRFVDTVYQCSEEERKKCINFPEYCEGSSHHLIDLEELIDKGIERAKERGEIK